MPNPILQLPPVDGWYWMRNITSGGDVRWRIVHIYERHDRSRAERIARDGQQAYTLDYLREWNGVEFFGPLKSPEDDACFAYADAPTPRGPPACEL